MSTALTLSSDETALLTEILESAYRASHREAWEVKHCGGAPEHLVSARARLSTIEALLHKLGSSAARAMAPVTETPETI